MNIYQRLYPNGYEIKWLDDPKNHPIVGERVRSLVFPIWDNKAKQVITCFNVRVIYQYSSMPNLDDLFAKEYR